MGPGPGPTPWTCSSTTASAGTAPTRGSATPRHGGTAYNALKPTRQFIDVFPAAFAALLLLF